MQLLIVPAMIAIGFAVGTVDLVWGLITLRRIRSGRWFARWDPIQALALTYYYLTLGPIRLGLKRKRKR